MSITQAERDALPASDFAGPDESFPIRTQEDVDSAAHLIGHAADPDAVKAKIIEIAKRKGLTLPDAWKSGSEERAMGAEVQPTNISFYAPFTRISSDGNKREVLGKATRGTPIDTYGTVITYEASKRAFERAKHIPIREMHQAKAVGKGIEWNGDDANEDIWLHSFVSRAADDTWTKVEENILTGYSIKGINAKYGTIQRNGKSLTAIIDYDLAEVSLVDNPSCPGCDITIMRADGIDQTVVATDAEVQALLQAEEAATPPATPLAQPETIERAGASMSKANRDKLHASRNSMMSMCAENGCTDCQAMMDLANGGSGLEDEHAVEERIMRFMAPVYARQQAMLSEFSRRQEENATLTGTITRIASTLEGLADKAKLDEVLGMIGQVKGQVERIAATPQPQGPHTGRAASKSLAVDGSAPQQEESDLLQQLHRSGVQLTPSQQTMLVAGNLKRI